jgi:sigma-B regulation protein RsbU (phosphoserine phosphatase)
MNILISEVSLIGLGNLDARIGVNTRGELSFLAKTFNKMTSDLKASIEQSARQLAENERIGAELNVATKIQASMLPCIFPAFPHRPEFDIHATMIPAKEVGGDFYDFFLIDETKLAIVIADVSGQGIPAALFMVIAKTLIKNNAQYGKSPKEVFEAVNSLLCENNEADMFVTVFMGYLDIATGVFTYVNAGHNPPLIKRALGQFEWLPAKPGFVLAGMEGMAYKQAEIQLAKGDMLFLYTDGVTEAVNPRSELFGERRLMEATNKHETSDPDEFIGLMKGKIDQFADGAEQADDITMLILEITQDCINSGG